MDDIFLTEINENLKIYQKRSGLTFGTDAYLLFAYMKRRKDAVAADLGAGTGVISLLAAAKEKFRKIYAFEIQDEFYALTEKNVKENKLGESVIPVKADIRNISASDFERPFDVVFTNPPYMKSGNGLSNIKDCKNIARHEENGEIYDFVLCAANILKFGGHFYAVYRPDRICDLLSAMRDNSLEPKRITFVYPRADAKPCLVLTECKKGAGSSAVITKPLIMYDDDGQYTQDLKYIYEYGEFNEQY